MALEPVAGRLAGVAKLRVAVGKERRVVHVALVVRDLELSLDEVIEAREVLVPPPLAREVADRQPYAGPTPDADDASCQVSTRRSFTARARVPRTTS